jgi:hypothetical protein
MKKMKKIETANGDIRPFFHEIRVVSVQYQGAGADRVKKAFRKRENLAKYRLEALADRFAEIAQGH